MLRRTRTMAAMAGGMLWLSTGAAAQDSGHADPNRPADVQGQLKTLLDEVKGLRAENEAMRGEIDELRARTQDKWLTERRAEEIRQIVQDVLADADTRTSLRDDGLVAGWSDGFFLASPDGQYRLNIGGQMQTRWIFNSHKQQDHYVSGFENARTKLIFQGHVVSPDWVFKVQTDFSRDGGQPVLQDAWIQHDFTNDISIRFGQFKLPFTHEFLVSSADQMAIERSLIDHAQNLGRSQGIELIIRNPVWRFYGAYSDGGDDNLGAEAGYNLAGSQPPPANTPAIIDDTEYSGTVRFEVLVAGEWDQFDEFTSPETDEFGMMVGAAFHTQQQEVGTSGPRETRWLAWTSDISIDFGGASLFASFTQDYIDAPTYFANIYGLVGQAAIYLAPKWEVFARYEYGWTDFDLASGQFNLSDLGVATVGTNVYVHGQDVKWSADIGFGVTQVENFWMQSIAGYRTDAAGAEPQIVFRTQLQLLF